MGYTFKSFTGAFAILSVVALVVAAVMPLMDMNMIGDICALVGAVLAFLVRSTAILSGDDDTNASYWKSLYGADEQGDWKVLGLVYQIIYLCMILLSLYFML